jgi:hypothetical protein
MALGKLEKNGVIDRQKNPGPTGNRYLIIWEEPAAENKKPAKAASGTKRRPDAGSRKPQPPAASTEEIPVISDSDPLGLDSLVSQEPAIAASDTKRRPDAGSREPKKPQPPAANEESIPASGEIVVVWDPADPLGLDSLVSQEPAKGAAKTTQRRQRIKRPPKKPLVEMHVPYLIDDPESAPTPAAEKMEDQGAGRPASAGPHFCSAGASAGAQKNLGYRRDVYLVYRVTEMGFRGALPIGDSPVWTRFDVNYCSHQGQST